MVLNNVRTYFSHEKVRRRTMILHRLRKAMKIYGSVFKILICIILIISVKHIYWGAVNHAVNHPVVVWWTSNFSGVASSVQRCKNNAICEFTDVKKRRYDENTEAFLFYGSDFDYLDLPLPRHPRKYIWGLLHEESPRNTLIVQHEAALQLFNYSSTISRHSDVPLTLMYLSGLQDLLTHKYFIPTIKKNTLLSELSPVLYIQTDCDTASYRDNYVKELMKYIPVDSYGKCLNNKQLPKELTGDYLNNLNSEEFLNFVARYKFTLSFENAICDDYITEKLWRPLKVGSVPIYMGSPSIRDWLPNDSSALISDSFESPKHLAAYIEYLNAHDDKYESYLQHKLYNKITNSRLISSLDKRTWKMNGNDVDSFIYTFECFICEKIHERRNNVHFKYSVADRSHYNCPPPALPLGSSQLDMWWVDQWSVQQKLAAAVHKLVVQENRPSITELDISKYSL